VHAAPPWVTVKVWPAIVAVPVREVVAVLAAMLIVTVPLPTPLTPSVTLIHDVALDALHAQPPGLVTATLVRSPAATTVALVGLIE
jgi:hypothetical protein